MTGIYKITDKESGKSYIGQSKNIAERWKTHMNNFEIGRGINKYHPELKIENLVFEIVELCPKEKLDEKEVYWIAHYDTFWNGFNRTMGGQQRKPEERKMLRDGTHPYI